MVQGVSVSKTRACRQWSDRSAKVKTEVFHMMIASFLHQMNFKQSRTQQEVAARLQEIGGGEKRIAEEVFAMEEGDKPVCRDQKKFSHDLPRKLTKDSEIAKVRITPKHLLCIPLL
jgi:hypothetical protein